VTSRFRAPSHGLRTNVLPDRSRTTLVVARTKDSQKVRGRRPSTKTKKKKTLSGSILIRRKTKLPSLVERFQTKLILEKHSKFKRKGTA